MRIIVQNSRSGHFLSPANEWVVDEAEAMVFKSSLAALGYLFEKQMRNAVLVMRFSDPQYDIRLDPFNDRASISGAVEQEAPNEPGAHSEYRLGNTQPPQAFVAGTSGLFVR